MATNGSWVTTIMKTRAGSSGGPGGPGAQPGRGPPDCPWGVAARGPWWSLSSSSYSSEIFSASACDFRRAASTDWRPAMAALISRETLVPRSVNSGMPTNWMPGAGRGCTPGSFGRALSMASLVISWKAAAEAR